MKTALSLSACALLLSACASTTDRGWSGQGAVPFDAARDECRVQVAREHAEDARRQAFEACMAGKGWHRR